MRRVLRNTDEVFHYWANGVQDAGKCGNVRFDGRTVFSYAEPIGYVYDGHVLLRNLGWSITSSRHCSQAWRASQQFMPIMVASLPHGDVIGNVEHRENRKHFEALILDNFTKANEPRRRKARDRYLATARAAIQSYTDYRELFDLDWPSEPDAEIIKAELDKAEAAYRAEQAAQQARIEAERQERIAEQQEALNEWRAGKNPQDRFEQTALRVVRHISPTGLAVGGGVSSSTAEIETTHGARIPAAHAMSVWPVLCRVKRSGRQIGEFYGVRLGHYSVTNFDGETLTVGCHRIPWAELELIANELGLPAYEPAKEVA